MSAYRKYNCASKLNNESLPSACYEYQHLNNKRLKCFIDDGKAAMLHLQWAPSFSSSSRRLVLVTYILLAKVHLSLPIANAITLDMPTTAALGDAAIALSRALSTLGVEHGVFGGYAVAVLGGPRASKDIDCAVNCQKEWLVRNLSAVEGFKFTGNARPDLVVFLYGDKNILIELFPSTFNQHCVEVSLTNTTASMSVIRTTQVQVRGERSGLQVTKILDLVFIYKGKLQAAATRAKHSDAADLLYLEGEHKAELRAHNNQINRQHVGMALKRYPHLEHSFERLGLDLKACKAVAREMDLDTLPATSPPNAVQNGLLFNLRVP
jgi:hypothetical protein